MTSKLGLGSQLRWEKDGRCKVSVVQEHVKAQRTGVCVTMTLSSTVEGVMLAGGDGEVRKGESTEDFVGCTVGLWIFLRVQEDSLGALKMFEL